MTLARRLAFVASLTAAGAAGITVGIVAGAWDRWWRRRCAPGTWREVDDLLLGPMAVDSLTPPNNIYLPGWPQR